MPKRHLASSRTRRDVLGFTLIELLVSMAILSLILALLLVITNNLNSTIQRSNAIVDAFGSIRLVQDTATQRLSQATLNSYWDYYDANGLRRTADTSFVPAAFGRASDLQFVVKQTTAPSATVGQEIYFAAPLAFSNNANYQSSQGLLNACGLFVQYGSDGNFRPTALTASTPLRWRYRLMQMLQPTEDFQIYQKTGDGSWIASPAGSAAARPVADNVIAMCVWPRLPATQDAVGDFLSKDYTYDSKAYAGATGYTKVTANQLPPMVQIAFVVIDEASAGRIDTRSSTPPAQIVDVLSPGGSPAYFTKIKSTAKTDGTPSTQFQDDLDSIGAALSAKHINYRIMTISIALRESKWSQ